MCLSSDDTLTPSIDNSLLNIEPIFLQNMRESAKTCSFWHPEATRSCRYRGSSGRNATLRMTFWPTGFLQFFNFLALFAINRDVLVYVPCFFPMPKFSSSTSQRGRKWGKKVSGVASHELRIPAHHRSPVKAPKRDKKGLDSGQHLCFITHFASKPVKK